MTDFLPNVKVTTIVWADKGILTHSQWEVAQGDDLKNQRSTIELNLPKLIQRGNLEAVAQGIVESWLSIEVVFATRQDLIDKQCRGEVKDEDILYNANLKVILGSPVLRRKYSDLAIDEILDGQWFVDDDFKELAEKIKALLSRWRKVSEELDNLKDKCYLCGRQLLSPDATLREHLEFTTETPYATVKPTPFIDTIVWVCSDCQPLAKEMGLAAEPLEIKMKLEE